MIIVTFYEDRKDKRIFFRRETFSQFFLKLQEVLNALIFLQQRGIKKTLRLFCNLKGCALRGAPSYKSQLDEKFFLSVQW